MDNAFKLPSYKDRYGRTAFNDPMFDIHLSEVREALADVDAHIESSGHEVLWYRAIQCPCRNRQTGKAKYDCGLCDGIGFQYIDPETIKVVIQGRNYRKDAKTIGFVDMGTCNITWPRGKVPGAWDKIVEKKEIAVITNEILTRGQTDTLGNSREKVRHKHLISVEICVDQDGVRYAQGINFDIKNDRYIDWTGPAPVDGKQYSLRYLAHPEYVIMSAEPMFRMEGDDILPYRSTAQRVEFINYES
jgi:hypothetical protein